LSYTTTVFLLRDDPPLLSVTKALAIHHFRQVIFQSNISNSVIKQPIKTPSSHQQLNLNAVCDHEVSLESRRPSVSLRHFRLH